MKNDWADVFRQISQHDDVNLEEEVEEEVKENQGNKKNEDESKRIKNKINGNMIKLHFAEWREKGKEAYEGKFLHVEALNKTFKCWWIISIFFNAALCMKNVKT